VKDYEFIDHTHDVLVVGAVAVFVTSAAMLVAGRAAER